MVSRSSPPSEEKFDLVYVLIAYDVEARRTERFRKLLARYLVHEQFSVFGGDLTESQLRTLEHELGKMLKSGDRILQISSANRHNVSVRILKKSTGNESMIKEPHDHHKTDTSII